MLELIKNQFPLLLRTGVLYPLSGLAAMYFGFVEYNPETHIMTIDMDAAGTAIAAGTFALLNGGTFAWSRRVKANGGAV